MDQFQEQKVLASSSFQHHFYLESPQKDETPPLLHTPIPMNVSQKHELTEFKQTFKYRLSRWIVLIRLFLHRPKKTRARMSKFITKKMLFTQESEVSARLARI